MRLGRPLHVLPPSPSPSRTYSTQANVPIIHIPKANIYRFGDSNSAQPVIRGFEWTVNGSESWAVVGTEKTALFQTLAGHLRISPVPPPPLGLFPFLSIPTTSPPRDPYTSVSLVSFAHRPRGPFFDYTARYGAVREEDRITVRQSMYSASSLAESLFNTLTTALELTQLLDLPLIALSNGQMRRARIVKALMGRPELLLLDEPLTGLDASTRPLVLSLLHTLHRACSPRIILGLRSQDSVPDWIEHVLRVERGECHIGLGVGTGVMGTGRVAEGQGRIGPTRERELETRRGREEKPGKVLVDLKNVKVHYHERKVLSGINWTIRTGERWHLQGANGSGKTTLLALLTGDHPQSYTQTSLPFQPTDPSPLPSRALTLFTQPRPRIPTAHLRALIGVVSPELANAFPRRGGMTVWEAVGTGFEGGFVSKGREGVGIGDGFGEKWRARYGLGDRGEDERQMAGEGQGLGQAEVRWRVGRCWEVLEALGPEAWGVDVEVGVDETGGITVSDRTRQFAARVFASLSAGEQSVVLLMRALVGRPPLVLLDEVWSGMEEGMIRTARQYLRGGVRGGDGLREDQAVVVVSHWEEELPWRQVRKFRLEAGNGWVVDE